MERNPALLTFKASNACWASAFAYPVVGWLLRLSTIVTAHPYRIRLSVWLPWWLRSYSSRLTLSTVVPWFFQKYHLNSRKVSWLLVQESTIIHFSAIGVYNTQMYQLLFKKEEEAWGISHPEINAIFVFLVLNWQLSLIYWSQPIQWFELLWWFSIFASCLSRLLCLTSL